MDHESAEERDVDLVEQAYRYLTDKTYKSDCSLFAVAFAQVLCAGLDPHLATFDQKSMREHLYSVRSS